MPRINLALREDHPDYAQMWYMCESANRALAHFAASGDVPPRGSDVITHYEPTTTEDEYWELQWRGEPERRTLHLTGYAAHNTGAGDLDKVAWFEVTTRTAEGAAL